MSSWDTLSETRSPITLSAFTHRLQRNLEDYGWSITLRKTIAYLFGFIYFKQIYRVYRIDLNARTQKECSAGKDFTFKILTPQDVNEITQIESMAEWLRGQLKERITSGYLCLVALDGSIVAGFNLISFDTGLLVLVNLKKKLRSGRAWSEHIGLKREYQKARLGSRLRYGVFEILRKRGVRWFYGGTLRSNIASLNLTRSVGFRVFADIHYVRLFRTQRWRVVRVRP